MNKLNVSDNYNTYKGTIEIIIKDRSGHVVDRIIEPNLIKVFAKEMISHRLPYSKYWSPTANSGAGGWVNTNIDPNEEFSIKYMLFGASFDGDNSPIEGQADNRFYRFDTVSSSYVALSPSVGASNDGDLINPIPINAASGRPIKKIEKVSFAPSYQPADSPLVDDKVRAINNVVVFETTLRAHEYNGFGVSDGEYFLITEIALAGGRLVSEGACECPPQYLFLEGVGGAHDISLDAEANGGPTVTIDSSVSINDVNRFKIGDQVLVVGRAGSAETYDKLGQVNAHYLVTDKLSGGRELQLDRTPVDINGDPITGQIGVYRNTLRLFNHKIISQPYKKSIVYEVTIKWSIIFN